jgi:DDE superfamily endonuclease
LLPQIIWPEEWMDGDGGPSFILSVDGVHCPIEEPMHETKPKNPIYYSHKFKKAALDYELGISITSSCLVWISGPHPASWPDIKVFNMAEGLASKIPDGKMAIGDKGYVGAATKVTTPNPMDPPLFREFKSRVRARHESFNAKIKNFACLDEVFRHPMTKHQIAFEAVCVICQYQMEIESPLFPPLGVQQNN